MASSLILHKRITTTLAKAKALRVYVEPLITKSKNDTTHSRRIVFSYLQNKEVVSMLFRDVAAKVANRPGGYTRILKLENRLGDNASMALIELVDYNEVYTSGAAVSTEKKSTRRRGSKSKKATDTSTTAPVAAKEEVAADAPVAKVENAENAEVEVQAAETSTEQAESTETSAPEAPASEEETPKEEK